MNKNKRFGKGLKRMIYDLIAQNIYTALFLGLLLGGETVLLPAIYFGLSGVISLQGVIGISIIATAISDSFWYYIGHVTPVEKISSLGAFKTYRERLADLSDAFNEHGLLLLFFSKFVYGTRTAMEILCGVSNIVFVRYFFVNLFGILALNAFFVLLGVTIKETFAALVDSPQHLWLALGTFAICTVTFHVLFKRLIWEKWSPS